MSHPTMVDVIIPTYNGLPWLQPAIDSVLSQSYKNLKLYVVDDGSTDGTGDFVKSLKDKRVVYIRKDNRGQSSARNLGIQKSTSPFIAFLDADDIWYPEKLEKQVALIEKGTLVGLVYGHHYLIDEEDIIQGNLLAQNRGAIFERLCHGNIITGSASMVLVRREILEKVGLFREDFVNGEDWELWLRIAQVCEIDFVPEIIAAIRQHSNSTQVNFKRMADGLVYAFGQMTATLSLTKSQRVYLASYCYINALNTYRNLGERRLARSAASHFLRENPRAIIELENWATHIAPGIYTRAFFGNKIFDLISAAYNDLLSVGTKLLAIMLRVILLPARVIRKLGRMTK